MDLNYNQITLPSESATNNVKRKYTFQHPYQQILPFHYTSINYIINNPTAEVWKKLIQTCKYFFSKNPLYPVDELNAFTFDNIRCTITADETDIDPNTNVPKLWALNAFCGGDEYSGRKAVSLAIPRIAKFQLRTLDLRYQGLKLHEYHILTASGSIETLNLVDVTIKQSDGSNINADKLFDNLNNIKEFKL
uniref:Uncharacterized protein n=1 Tax=Panagrolaimus sp. ES5 TaxID=591445 RepID=A0AC34G7C1_9BILA